SKKDGAYLKDYIKPLCTELFAVDPKIQNLPKNNETFVTIYSKKLVEFLNSIGLKSGDKIRNQIGIPSWVFENKNFLKVCLRGLIDTDGSIFRMSNKDSHLLRINFTNHNKKLLNDARLAFIKLGFHPSKIICNNKIYISRKEDIVRYIKEIGFSNNKHINRYHEFNSPVV
ncbi:MAG: LAGLIDADG family homing endonuclease, partial [Nanoarchaeota archaeon]